MSHHILSIHTLSKVSYTNISLLCVHVFSNHHVPLLGPSGPPSKPTPPQNGTTSGVCDVCLNVFVDTCLQYSYRMGGKFRAIQDFAYLENFAGSNSTFHEYNFRVISHPRKTRN